MFRFAKKLVMLGVHVVFPKSPEEELTKDVTAEDLRKHLKLQSRNDVITFFSYENETVKALIWQLKFKSKTELADILSEILSKHLERYTTPHVIIPVPLSRERFRERGFNQVSEIVRNAAPKAGCVMYIDNVLVRTRNTKPQMKLSKQKRLKNVEGAFSVPYPDKVAGKKIVLVDDIVTTGSTLKEAREALLEAGAHKVDMIAIAHA